MDVSGIILVTKVEYATIGRNNLEFIRIWGIEPSIQRGICHVVPELGPKFNYYCIQYFPTNTKGKTLEGEDLQRYLERGSVILIQGHLNTAAAKWFDPTKQIDTIRASVYVQADSITYLYTYPLEEGMLDPEAYIMERGDNRGAN